MGESTSDRAEKFVLVMALMLAGVGLFLIVLSREAVPYATLWPSLLLVGVDSGLVLPATAAVISIPVESAGAASTVVNASRQARVVLGVAGDGGAAFIEGLRIAGFVCPAAFVTGAAVSLVYVRAPRRRGAQDEAGDLALELYPTGREATLVPGSPAFGACNRSSRRPVPRAGYLPRRRASEQRRGYRARQSPRRAMALGPRRYLSERRPRLVPPGCATRHLPLRRGGLAPPKPPPHVPDGSLLAPARARWRLSTGGAAPLPPPDGPGTWVGEYLSHRGSPSHGTREEGASRGPRVTRSLRTLAETRGSTRVGPLAVAGD